jgi:molecular chaperone GrpE
MTEAKKIRVVNAGRDDAAPGDNGPKLDPGPAVPPAGAGGGDSAVPGEASVEMKLKAELETRQKEYDEVYDKFLRVSAEFENYKKRAAREMDDLRKFANQSLLKEMLSALDHIELALESAKTAPLPDRNLVDGLGLTLKELLRVFDKCHVTPIESVGQPFNPEFHEAMMREESTLHPANTVVREMQKGYLINGRLLRPALVAVAAPAADAAGGETGRE